MCVVQPFKISLFAIVVLFGTLTAAQQVLTAGQVPSAYQDYDFSAKHRCRLLAHSSVVLKNNDHHILVADGGFGSFATTINGSQVRVLDLNPYTVVFDLSKDFDTTGLEPLFMYKKPNGTSAPPVLNHACLWASQHQDTIWLQGGHYYNASSWSSSLYHIDKSQIPPWQVWQMNVTQSSQGWKDVTDNIKGHEVVNRTFAGSAASVTKANVSFWVGGLLDGTTSSDSPTDTLQTTDQMLVFNQSDNTITRQKYYYPQSTKGQYYGNLIHLPVGPGSGYLMSLMTLEYPTSTPWHDVDGADGSKELGTPVALDSIPLYDIDAGTWFEQETSWYMNQIPLPRTRFCSALFFDQVDNTWNLWIHGGQEISDEANGVPEIYVLSMPSFIWSKLETPLSSTNLIRSHTCHAVGGQLVIVGGYPPSENVATNVTCDAEYIKVLSIGESGVSWTGQYSTESTYRTPQIIRNVVNQKSSPMSGFANPKLEANFRWMPPHSGSNVSGIVGGVVGGLARLAIIVVILWFLRKRKIRGAVRVPSPPPHSHLEVIRDGNIPAHTRRALPGMVQTANTDRGDRYELPSPTADRHAV